MKNKITAFILSLITFVCIAMPVMTGASEASSDAEEIINGILDFKMNEYGIVSVNELIDKGFAANAGTGAEWYVFGLGRYSMQYDFSIYEKSLVNYLKEKNTVSASGRLKYAVVLASLGSKEMYINDILDDSIGKQGIMSYVFGLHLLNNGYTCSSFDTGKVRDTIISMQLADGGWAVSGDRGDVDVTAMVIQSLTPYYTCESEATDAIDKALRFLSENQLPDGTFSSYGNANVESTAQVLTALSGLGIDCKTDTEFIKENDIIEAMKLFRLYDGSFSHLKDSQTNDSATAEALYSFAAYQRMLEGRSSLYIFEDEEMHKTETLPDEKKSGGYKLPVCIAVASTGVIVCAVLFIMKKRNYKNFAVVLILTISGIVFVWTTDFYSGEDYYGKETVKKKIIGEVTLSITCDSLSDKAKKDFIPEDCIILSDASYKLGDGDTVSDILTEACRVNGIQLDKTDGYVSGINYLYEFDYGELSGWIYAVNGKKASVGSDEYVLGDGDSIEWYYTCEMGNDMEMSE